MSMLDELTLLDDIRNELNRLPDGNVENLMDVRLDDEIVVLDVLPPELIEFFFFLRFLEAKVSHAQRGVTRLGDKVEAGDSAAALHLLKHRNELSILVEKCKAVHALFYGTLKKFAPRYASGEWLIRKGFVVVVIPAWDPETGEPCAEHREALSK